MTNNVKKIIGGAIALAGAFMALNTKEEKKSETAPVEGSNSSTTEVKTKSEEISETEEKTEE